MKQSYKNCRWQEVCIDPCDGCPNMNAVKFDGAGEPIEETLCPYEQGSKECYKLVCLTCKDFQEKTKNVYDPEVERIKRVLS